MRVRGISDSGVESVSQIPEQKEKVIVFDIFLINEISLGSTANHFQDKKEAC